jgi:hypothetical protein
MAETNNPLGTDLASAQNAIRQMMAPQEDNAAEPNALEAEAEEVIEAEAEMPEGDEEYSQEYDTEAEGELETEEDYEQDDNASFDILAAKVEVDGEEITVEELKNDRLRQRDYTRKTQELADLRREVDARDAEIARKDAQYAQLLPALQERLEQPMEQEPDWDKLYDTDPNMAARAERQWRKQQDERNAQLEAIRQERMRMAELDQQRNAEFEARYTEEQRNILPDLIPEWRDTKVAKQEATDLRNFLLTEGFTENDVNGLRNATLVKLARKAMLYDRGQTRATQAKTAKPKPKAKTLKTGSRGSQPKPKSAQSQALQRARQTGRMQDAAAAIKSLL